uniref:HIRAN domain-containing protein n=1 Tax=Amphimedon queenslandica TaxID=400682 RepID=A0A1X7U5P3_AMPQE
MSEEHFEISSVVRGYHVYKDMLEATERESLQCTRELSNSHDPYAVAIFKNGYIVGHVPRIISAVCSLFLRWGGSIQCTVIGSRKYSEDLPQGGLEIPCLYPFRVPTGNKDKELVEKTQTRIKRVYSTASSDLRQQSSHKLIPPAAEPTTSHEEALPPKKKKVEDLDDLAKWTEPFPTTG